MRTTIQSEEETVTEEVLRRHPDATEWEAGSTLWDNGYFLHNEVTVTTPAGYVNVDLEGTVGEDALRELSDLIGGVGERTVHTVAIEENWSPTPPAPHVFTLHDAPETGQRPGSELEIHVESIGDDGVTGGDLAGSGGHLYVKVDGVDIGALRFHRPTPGGPVAVTLGAFDPETGDWTPADTLHATAA